jgi:molybdate transport system substrate-binding protein
MRRRFLLFAALLLPGLSAAPARADEIRIVSSGGFAAAYKELAPRFERETGHTLVAGWGPSMGDTADAVPQRLARHEPIDVVIMVGYALGKLVEQGKVAAADRRDLAQSGIGVVVRHGAPHPDISTLDGLRAALLTAKSIAYSDSASGVYIQEQMFRKLGIEDQVKGRARMIPAEPVGAVVARGEAELGFQQISELKPIQGIDLVGPLPAGAQQVTVFSGGVLAESAHKEAGRALLRFLSSPGAADTIRSSGMDPIPAQGN